MSIHFFTDIHGCLRELEILFKAVNPKKDDTIIFGGDYIDRGSDSKGVVQFIINTQKTHFKVETLLGNHEDMFMNYLNIAGQGDLFLHNGGMPTLKSYGCEKHAVLKLSGGYCNNINATIDTIGVEHVQFYNSLKLLHEEDGHIFVHAGLKPDEPQQSPFDLIWIRPDEYYPVMESLDCKIFKPIIHGHTPVKGPHPIIKSIDNKIRAINVDNWCVYGGWLSCLTIDGDKYYYNSIKKDDSRVNTGELL